MSNLTSVRQITAFTMCLFLKLSDLGALLSLMIGSSAEDFSLVLTFCSYWEAVKLESDALLQNVRTVTKRIKVCLIYNHVVIIDELSKEEAPT